MSHVRFWGRTKKMGQSSDGFLSPIETTCLEVTKLIILVHLFGEKTLKGWDIHQPYRDSRDVLLRKSMKIYFNPSFQPKKTPESNKQTKTQKTHTHTHCCTKTSSDESKRMIPWPVITNLRSVAT